MRTVNIDEAKTHLSRPVEQAAAGEPFIAAKPGKPMVKVVPLGPETARKPRRIRFLTGQVTVPKDFDRMSEKEIERLLGRAG